MRRLLAVILLLFPCSAFAWNGKAHRIIAAVAERQLGQSSPYSLKQALDLLGEPHLADVATLPDDWAARRGTWHTAPWHFVKIPYVEMYYDAERDCPHGACAVAALEELHNVFTDPKAEPRQRKEALTYYVHLMGDIFQPWRSSDGGTAIAVKYKGGHVPGNRTGDPRNDTLFFVWDVSLLEYDRHSEREMVNLLFSEDFLAGRNTDDIHAGGYQYAAEETHKGTRDSKVADGANLDDRYMGNHVGDVEEQLLQAGCDLAYQIKCAFPAPGKVPCQNEFSPPSVRRPIE